MAGINGIADDDRTYINPSVADTRNFLGHL
jgi:hypothetical protein